MRNRPRVKAKCRKWFQQVVRIVLFRCRPAYGNSDVDHNRWLGSVVGGKVCRAKMVSRSRVECSPVTKRSEAHEQSTSYGSDIVFEGMRQVCFGQISQSMKVSAECRMEYRRQFQRGGRRLLWRIRQESRLASVNLEVSGQQAACTLGKGTRAYQSAA
jgi:hypothetical protein